MLRGEVWLINLDATVGAEIRKTRPAVIVSADAIGVLPLRVVVPLAERRRRRSFRALGALARQRVRVGTRAAHGLEVPAHESARE